MYAPSPAAVGYAGLNVSNEWLHAFSMEQSVQLTIDFDFVRAWKWPILAAVCTPESRSYMYAVMSIPHQVIIQSRPRVDIGSIVDKYSANLFLVTQRAVVCGVSRELGSEDIPLRFLTAVFRKAWLGRQCLHSLETFDYLDYVAGFPIASDGL